MSAQLRADIVRAFAAACEQVTAYQVDAPDLIGDVMRLVYGTLRFLEPNEEIAEARRAVQERLGSIVRLIDHLSGEDIPAPPNGRAYPAVTTARAHALQAINHLQAQAFAHGRVNAAGDRVGLGKVGDLIR